MMIANRRELQVAARNLSIFAQSLQALREQLATENPGLLASTEGAYVRRIESLQQDIASYLCEHPTDISLILASATPDTFSVEPEKAAA